MTDDMRNLCISCGGRNASQFLEPQITVGIEDERAFREEPIYMEPLNGTGSWELYIMHKNYTKSVVKIVSDNYATLLIHAYGTMALDEDVRGIDMHFEGTHKWNIRLLGNGKYQLHQQYSSADIWTKETILEWLSHN